ncbi:hypothetical protein PHYPSEUDO_014805 [Phytophthora pseudosyringae]|uniref:Uncharacterized protein n=1 Tax=Phytophthora pseudosyringae TaxID=221518 RepID=A0A8T1W0S5_9STRA|nr:hypothetical protein PHYPSEUDO_014805 [Phytophthora pseudosyringae]
MAGELPIVQIINRAVPELPEELTSCQQLEQLILAYTKTEHLPEWLAEFSHLEYIHIEGDFTADIFDNMPHLAFLHLDGIPNVETLPSLSSLKSLHYLTLAVLVSPKEIDTELEGLLSFEYRTVLNSSFSDATPRFVDETGPRAWPWSHHPGGFGGKASTWVHRRAELSLLEEIHYIFSLQIKELDQQEQLSLLLSIDNAGPASSVHELYWACSTSASASTEAAQHEQAKRLDAQLRQWRVRSKRASIQWLTRHNPALLGLGALVEMKSRPPPELKEQQRLMDNRVQLFGDKEQGMQYFTAAYGSTKDLPMPPVCAWVLVSSLRQRALSHYDAATKLVKAVTPTSLRCTLGVTVLDQMGMCYQQSEQHEQAERVYNKAIRGYEKFQGQLSLSQPSLKEAKTLESLDLAMSNVFLHFSTLLISMDRADEVSLIRERTLRLVRNSAGLQTKENKVMDQFDDKVAIFSMQHERRLKRQEESQTTGTAN